MGKNSKPEKGRPTRYTLVVVKIICDRLSNGETLRSVCRDETHAARINRKTMGSG